LRYAAAAVDRRRLRLDAREREAWEQDGFFVRRSAFDEAELAALRDAAERVAARAEQRRADPDRRFAVDGNVYLEAEGSTIQLEHGAESRELRVIEPFHHLDPRFDALMDDPRLVEPMRGLVGSERVALYTDKLNLKRPREGSRFRWHQDSPYWFHFCAHLDRLPNVMLALDDADEENGCFRVVRGSHRRGCLPGLQGEGQLGPLFTDPRHFDLSAQVPVVVPAGSLVFFSPHTVHGSEPNRSDRPRRALVITYQPAGHPMFRRTGQREVDPPALA
jgi:ectoine hydroxylase-related dioxygenase (phytanoyl-CoA dioxygenase family)